VARIHTAFRDGRYYVTIRGDLSIRDLRRLEWACSRALEHERVPADISIAGVTMLDEASRLFLQKLASRGAIVLHR
jgi:hypothetical protein